MAENSSKNLLNTRSHLLRFSTPAKKIPTDGNLAILDDICQQVPVIKIYQRYSEIPRKDWKTTKINVITSKKFGKTLGKRLLPESNRSWRPIPGGRKFQNHIIGQ